MFFLVGSTDLKEHSNRLLLYVELQHLFWTLWQLPGISFQSTLCHLLHDYKLWQMMTTRRHAHWNASIHKYYWRWVQTGELTSRKMEIPWFWFVCRICCGFLWLSFLADWRHMVIISVHDSIFKIYLDAICEFLNERLSFVLVMMSVVFDMLSSPCCSWYRLLLCFLVGWLRLKHFDLTT